MFTPSKRRKYVENESYLSNFPSEHPPVPISLPLVPQHSLPGHTHPLLMALLSLG